MHYLGRPLLDLLQGEPLAPLAIKSADKIYQGREMILRVVERNGIWEIVVGREVLAKVKTFEERI
jgi:hypothetical protein